MNKATRNIIDFELAKVDQDEFYDCIFVLRRSRPACEMFARLQMMECLLDMTSSSDDYDISDDLHSRYYDEYQTIAACLEPMACEVMNHCPRWVIRLNRICVTQRWHWIRLSKALGSETKLADNLHDECYKTILGWRQF